MDIGEALFAVKGRIGRGPFVALTVIGWAMSFGFVRYNPLLVLQHGLPQTYLVLGLALLPVWISIAITMKRLHDVGLSGLNTIWIGLLGMFGDPLAIHSPLLLAAAAISISAQIWLCIQQGNRSANRLGNVVAS